MGKSVRLARSQRLTFPDRCLYCGGSHDGKTLVLGAWLANQGWRKWLLGPYNLRESVTFNFPVCAGCQRKGRKYVVLLMLNLAVSCLIGLSIAACLYFFGPIPWQTLGLSDRLAQ